VGKKNHHGGIKGTKFKFTSRDFDVFFPTGLITICSKKAARRIPKRVKRIFYPKRVKRK